MNFQIPQQRRPLNPIEIERRKIPIDQIIEIMGNNPLGQGIAETGKVIGAALAQRAANQKKGQQLATLEGLSGQQPGAYKGLDPDTAATLTGSYVKNSYDTKKEAAELAQKTLKVRALENQFGYKPNELGDDYDAAKIKVQSDLMEKRATEAANNRPEPDESYTIAGTDKNGNVIQIGNKSGKLRKITIDKNDDGSPGILLPKTVGTEEQRRSALVGGAKKSIDDIRSIIKNNPEALNELKAIKFTPGRVYSQLASPAAKRLYINLKEAMSNEIYLKTGATANEQELENSAVSYMAALNDNPAEFLGRMDLLERNVTPFDSRSGSSLKTLPVSGSKAPTMRWNPATGKVEPL